MTASDTIELGVPLRAEYAAHLRLLVASVAGDAGFSVDELDDLRLGVSEIFTLLLDGADDGARAFIELSVDGGRIALTVGRSGVADAPDVDELAAAILSSVVDEYTTVPGGIVMSKRATESATPR